MTLGSTFLSKIGTEGIKYSKSQLVTKLNLPLSKKLNRKLHEALLSQSRAPDFTIIILNHHYAQKKKVINILKDAPFT